MTSTLVSFGIGMLVAVLARVVNIPENDPWRLWSFILIMNALFTLVRMKV